MSEHSYLFTYVNDQDIESFLENNDSYFYNINFLGTSGLISTQGKIYGDAISTETMSYINDKFELSYSYILDLNYSMNETSYVINKAIISLNDRLETAGVWEQGTGTNAVQTKNASNNASGGYSVAEGYNTQASKYTAHAEGENTIASGFNSHAEGYNTQASGGGSHAEGSNTIASGDSSHAEGSNTIASGFNSHAEGCDTQSTNNFEHASGFLNISHTNTLFSVGNGYYDDHGNQFRKNTFEIMSNGDMYIYGVYDYDGQTINSKKTLQKFLELTPLSNSNYDNIFGIQGETPSIEISPLLMSHFIIDDSMQMGADDNYDGDLDAYIQDVVDAAEDGALFPVGSNRFEWTGETIEIDDETYNVWVLVGGQIGLYGLTETTLTLQECIDNSMAEDSSNAWSPFAAMMREDYIADSYDPQEDYQLVYVQQYDYSGDYDIGDFNILDATLLLDNFSDGNRASGYTNNIENIRKYVTYYYENEESPNGDIGAIYEYTGETIEIDGEEYYLWEDTLNNEYFGAMRMDMTASELKAGSKYQNPFSLWCPFEYTLDVDNELDGYNDIKDKRRCLVAIIGA